MGLFGKKGDKRKSIKKDVLKVMKEYDKEKIDGTTYIQKMLDITSSASKKKK